MRVGILIGFGAVTLRSQLVQGMWCRTFLYSWVWQCDLAGHGWRTRVGAGNHECGMCLGNSVFNGVLGVSITEAKFAPEVAKF